VEAGAFLPATGSSLFQGENLSRKVLRLLAALLKRDPAWFADRFILTIGKNPLF
jgi:hypothetical protein